MESKTYKCRKDYIMECAEFKGVPAFIEGRTYNLNENRTGKSELFIEHDLSEEKFFDEYFEPVIPIQSPDADNTERGEVEEQCLKFFKKTLKKAGLREALNINDFGYSQIERDLVSGILAIANEYNPTPPTLLNELRENEIVSLEAKRLEWSLKLFKTANPISSIIKLQNELEEVIAELSAETINKEHLSEEYADCLMCLFDSAGRAGILPTDIFKSFSEKLKVNLSSEWIDNGNGTYSRIKPTI